jgi:aminoglycoside phosphotransferase
MADRDIDTVARRMIDVHGPNAVRAAEQRVRELVDEGNAGAADLWRQVAARVRDIQAGRP